MNIFILASNVNCALHHARTRPSDPAPPRAAAALRLARALLAWRPALRSAVATTSGDATDSPADSMPRPAGSCS